VGPDPSVEPASFDRRAIALRALDSAADGTELVDGLTGEVHATARRLG
jgi:DNA excision repair protein ERCC-4/Fanconi anemia group M protein